jgi:ketosteroid isomerase-like protein
MNLSRPILNACALLSLVALAGCWIDPSTNVRGEGEEGTAFTAQVDEILRLSAEAWNSGALDGFMVHYLRAPTTTYIGAGTLRVGFDAIRERFAPLFEPGAERDSLRFSELRARRLGQRHGLATARYTLFRNGTTTSTGLFTLVLLQVEGRWRIVHDQSAADPPVE